ncbi:NAD-dependent epimerase/dehydratase family protein [Rhizobium sp. R86522]|uniref:NAD-dependent epimerase/dehydratase family protein n=1 Tax=Rhizobium sp. R86522 TaxID=3093861 RepID=UPI00366F1FD1
MGLTLITGASGFVGSHLAADMRNRGMPIRAISRSESQGSTKIQSYAPETDWRPFLHEVDTVVHLAARVHVMRDTEADPLNVFRIANVDATLNLARQAAFAGVSRFIFMSTVKVNGEETQPGEPFTNLDPRNPQDPYAISKAEAEVGLLDVGRQTKMDVAIIRPPLVFGPRVGGNFATLMKWTERGCPSLFSHVKNKRSMIYVGNLTDFVIAVISYADPVKRHFLISDQPALSTDELFAQLRTATGRAPRAIPVPRVLLDLADTLTGNNKTLRRLLSSLEIDDQETRKTFSWKQPFEFTAAITETVSTANRTYSLSQG